MKPILLVLSAALVVSAMPAWAQPAQIKLCENKNTAARERLAACSRVIENRQTRSADKSWAFYNRGETHEKLGDKRKALEDFRNSRNIAEKNMDGSMFRLAAQAAAEAAFDLKEFVIATFMFIDALDPDEKDKGRKYSLLFLAGVSAANADQDKIALDLFNEAIEVSPEIARGYRERGAVYWLTKDHDKALADLNKAIELDAKDSKAHLYRARVYTDTGKAAEARTDLLRAIDLDPSNADAIRALQNLKKPE